jgi:urease accessory protein
MNLHLLQITDSALPIGAYTHSWGLETAVAGGLVTDIDSLEQWVSSWLKYSLGPQEGVITGVAGRAARAGNRSLLERANEILTAVMSPPSLRQASREMGEQLLELGATWNWSAAGVQWFQSEVPFAGDRPRWHHAVIFGILASLARADAAETITVFLHQAVLGMITAGIRAVPIDHTHGQQLLAYMHDVIVRLAEDLAERDLDSAGSGAPFYEVLCDAQTRLYSRMFRS